jgi:hypothetical protein
VVPSVSNQAWVRNPVDAFILSDLEKRGLRPSPEADRRVLLRRVSLDLTGLPPTPDETRAFLADASPDAYVRAVDRLLASPRYGERWARHWMDIWRYSDWYGNRKSEDLRNSQRHIWRWRDWIVDSLNHDKGYDRMIVEMLAGDELAPADDQALAATGFLARNYFLKNRNTWLQDTVEYTSAAFLGLTLKCARCHSHKYDPIPQTDYYRFRAFFEPYDVRVDHVPGEVDTLKNGIARVFDGDPSVPTYRLIRGNEQSPDTANPLTPTVPELFHATLKIVPVNLPLAAWAPDSRSFVQQDLIAAAKADISSAEKDLRAALETLYQVEVPGSPTSAPENKNTAEATPGTGAKPKPKPAPTSEEAARQAQIARSRLLASQAFLPALEARIAAENAVRASAPSTEVETLAAAAGKLERKANALRAEYNLLGAQQQLYAAEAGEGSEADQKIAAARERVKAALDGLTDPGADSGLPYTPVAKTYPAASTGRRLTLARWIASGDNPLTARVAINHIWLRHFGTALVPTVANFGKSGKPPTNPELLDWLATEFVRQGWSMKAMHRLLVTSSAYRMASETTKASAANVALDTDNVYYWRMNPRRMEAEEVRDSLLYVAGKLDLAQGGPDIDEAQAEETYRRSLYFRESLNGQPQFLKAFDPPSPAECFERTVSVVPQQSLVLTNSRLSLVAARTLARRLSAQFGEGPEHSAAFITAAFEAILVRPPFPDELAASSSFLAAQTALLQNKANLTPFRTGAKPEIAPSPDAGQRARESFVHALFSHNEFITVR